MEGVPLPQKKRTPSGPIPMASSLCRAIESSSSLCRASESSSSPQTAASQDRSHPLQSPSSTSIPPLRIDLRPSLSSVGGHRARAKFSLICTWRESPSPSDRCCRGSPGGGSFREIEGGRKENNSTKKEVLLLEEGLEGGGGQFLHKHKIVFSDVVFKNRWSDVKCWKGGCERRKCGKQRRARPPDMYMPYSSPPPDVYRPCFGDGNLQLHLGASLSDFSGRAAC